MLWYEGWCGALRRTHVVTVNCEWVRTIAALETIIFRWNNSMVRCIDTHGLNCLSWIFCKQHNHAHVSMNLFYWIYIPVWVACLLSYFVSGHVFIYFVHYNNTILSYTRCPKLDCQTSLVVFMPKNIDKDSNKHNLLMLNAS